MPITHITPKEVEIEVCSLYRMGYSTSGIARRLPVSKTTVERILKRYQTKARTKREAMILYYQRGSSAI